MSEDKTTQLNQINNTLPLSCLIDFKFGNARNKMKTCELEELKSSIKELGVIQPITVRPSEISGMFEVIAGNRRWKASQELSLTEIPCLIRDFNDEQAYEAHLAENIERSDLSIVDEAKAAQRFVSLYEGNHLEAAKRLGWTPKKIKDRLELLKCSDSVLKALDENTISISHAVILAAFSEKLQNGTLEKVVSEKWTVEYLKERAGKAKNWLRKAKFDISDCSNCQHNTIHQNDMFDTNLSGDAQCANIPCWRSKTDEWLESQRFAAEERYGKVLLWVDSSKADRNTVSPSVVGQEQYENGCMGCVSKVAIMDNRSGKEGELIESQCVDKICFAKCTTAINTPTPPVNDDIDPSTTTHSEKATHEKTTVKTKETPTQVVQKTPKSVLLHEEKSLRNAGIEVLKDDPKIMAALLLSLANELSGYKNSITSDSYDFTQKFTKALQADLETINQQISESLSCFLADKKDECTTEAKSPTRLIIKALSNRDDSENIAKKAWKADKETLGNYTIDQIVALCEQSGFDKAYDSVQTSLKKSDNFAKVSKSGKAKFIKVITEFSEFDWSDFAPSTMLKHVSA
ncbi:PRTRC system ParB family protein [Thalassotalea piscium]|uniref:PRTRC genetic system ParB family protein n=1 Tax=Thalassotalea piscium TaxID=1230533 RepID=A0A7X0TTH2_9GAMM|nr:PRTRC system ParB family protein [Thalassotalea piscium]MBB6543148.1 PRTRC genetic system ParB family protein [Thalassotalea piscium]